MAWPVNKAEQVVYGYRLMASDGTRSDWVFVNDPGDNICIGIERPFARNSTIKQYEQFDSYEAYHLDSWAGPRGLVVERCKFVFEPEKMAFIKMVEEGYL